MTDGLGPVPAADGALLPAGSVAAPGPPAWVAAERAWLVTRYGETAALLRAPDAAVIDAQAGVDRLADRTGISFSSLSRLLGGTIIFRNAPFHAKARGFQARTLAVLRASFEDAALRPLAASLVASALGRGEVEVAKGICFSMPLLATSRAIGLTDHAAAKIAVAGDTILGACQVLSLRDLGSLETHARDVEAVIEEEMRRALADPTSGLSAMARLNAEEFGLSHGDFVGCVFFLVLASIETTASLLAHALYLFAAHPEQAALVRADPRLMERAVEEVLRLAGPIKQVARRSVGAGFRVGEKEFSSPAMLNADIEQAQRDPEAYPEPERFDILRKGPPALAFGLGAHACPGAAIARREAKTFLSEALAAADLGLGSRRPRWERSAEARQFEHLDLVFTPHRKESR